MRSKGLFDFNLARRLIRWRTVACLPALAVICAGQTQLFEAARTGDLAALRLVAANKELVDIRDANGRTALHIAAVNCQLEAAKILVGAGWNRTLADQEKSTPLALTSRCPRDSQALFHVILPPPVQENFPWSLQYAAGHHQAAVVSLLLKMGVDVNAAGSEGNRALDVSCLKGDAEITRLLLDHGANPALTNKSGGTPLHDAALSGNKDVIEILLACGADVNAVDAQSLSTPLHYAAELDRLNAATALVQHGASLNAKNANGLTALQVATKNGFDDVSRFLASVPSKR